MVWPGLYLFGLFAGEIGLNIAYAAHCGLPADLQGIQQGSDQGTIEDHDGETKSIISGYMSLHSFVGALGAMGVMVLTRTSPVQVQYPIFMVSLIVVCFVVCMSASETRTDHSSAIEDLTFKEFCDCFVINMSEDLDFFWVCASRVFFYCSISSTAFMYYYMRDLIIVGSDDATVRSHVATLVILAQIVGAACSIPCGHLSNTIGRKVVIYAANTLMSLTFTLYTIAPKFGSFAWPIVLFAGTIYGLGAATYVSVDYALALDCLPKGKTTAEAFGLWGVAGFLGSTIGPLLGGVLLWIPTAGSWPGAADQPSSVAAGQSIEGYSYIGYAMVLITTGPIMNLIGAILVGQIRGLKEDLPQECS